MGWIDYLGFIGGQTPPNTKDRQTMALNYTINDITDCSQNLKSLVVVLDNDVCRIVEAGGSYFDLTDLLDQQIDIHNRDGRPTNDMSIHWGPDASAPCCDYGCTDSVVFSVKINRGVMTISRAR